ncbi:MAG: TonB C-terminal domain-containing protein [Campylobacterota bacterium]|nr:TonB C-terminal domain-containing protein [Campylobacterota bacterium]
MDKNKNLIISAVISVSIYFLLIIGLIYYSLSRDIKKIDSAAKMTVLQLDIVLDDKKDVSVNKLSISSINNSTKKAQEIVKKSTSTSAKKRTNLKSLFAKVSTNAPKVKKDPVLNIKKSTISSRFKSKFEKERKTKKLSLTKLTKSQGAKKNTNTPTQSKNESDPYFSKIHDMINSRWNPTLFLDDISAKVIIVIGNNGTFSYQFIQYSNNIGFDNQLKEFLDGETTKSYPVNPNNKTTKIEISFKSKGE